MCSPSMKMATSALWKLILGNQNIRAWKMTSFSFSHFPPNYQKVSHERTIKSNFHSRITLKKKGGPNEFCGVENSAREKKALKERTIFQHSRKIVTNVRLNVKTIYLLYILFSKKIFWWLHWWEKSGENPTFSKGFSFGQVLELVGTPCNLYLLYTLFWIFIFCPKIQLWFPEKIVNFFWGEKLVKMLWFWTF